MKPLESTENYLERILMLREEKGQVRAVDIATALDFSKASVSNAMKRLREQGYITQSDDHDIALTEKGQAIAEKIYDRHTHIATFLMALGVSESVAYADACMIEHDLSDETYHCMMNHYQTHQRG